MEHEYWQERLQGYLDNELAPADHTAVKNHIDDCPECTADLTYFQSMKKRLLQHRDTVVMPDSVETRLQELFEKKRRTHNWRRFLRPAYGLALAAVITLAIVVPLVMNRPAYAFAEATLTGKITCTDCTIADRAGLEKGLLCKNGHQVGLIGNDGEIYRIAMDDEGFNLNEKLGSLFDSEVEIHGELLAAENLLRVSDLTEQIAQQASL